MLENDQEIFRVNARRRILVLGGSSALLIGSVVSRLFYLQVMKGSAYRDLAEDNRISLQPLPAPRGRIFDNSGDILVENRPDYTLMIIPELAGKLKETLEELRSIIELSDLELEEVLRAARNQRSFLPLKVKGHLTWEEVSKIEVRIHALSGLLIQVQSIRFYPFGSLASHLLGYLGEANDADNKRLAAQRLRPGELVGKGGVERFFETYLRGNDGVLEVEVNAYGRQVRELHTTPPIPGRDLQLSINVALQREAEAALEGETGAVVVLNPNSGEVLAMASTPAYDPNEFIRGITGRQWRSLISHPERPLTNKAIQGQYPPGSTFKIVTALAALAENKTTPSETVFCPGFLFRYGRRYHCWKKHGHGSVDLIQAIAQSCDVYFYKMAERIGIDAIDRQAKRMGLGKITGIGLENEKPGVSPSREWKQQALDTMWYPGETLINGIGQGYVLTTPLQLAVMISSVANGGIIYRPTLMKIPPGQSPEVISQHQFNPNDLAVVRAGLEEVMNGPRGTAKRHHPLTVRAAGKTGTAQVVRQRRAANGKAINSKERKFKDHALFVSYAPTDKPELAIGIIVEHGEHGSSTAAPIAKRIIDKYYAHLLPPAEPTAIPPEKTP